MPVRCLSACVNAQAGTGDRFFPLTDKLNSHFKDIAGRMAMEKEILTSRDLMLIGELAASIGLEINNPLMSIMSCARTLFDESNKGSKERDIALRIIKEGGRVAEVVRSLLLFASFDEEKKIVVSLYGIVKGSLLLTEMRLRGEGIKIKLDIPNDLQKILAHPQQIQQVFLNIINDARYVLNQKYPEVYENKILEISSEEITINNHPYVKTTFCDSGVSRDKAIDQFFVPKSRRSVTGVVLDDNYRIIENHGGKLITDSKEGKFTKVCVVLPVINQ
jgi:signal transduction histidine kinase